MLPYRIKNENECIPLLESGKQLIVANTGLGPIPKIEKYIMLTISNKSKILEVYSNKNKSIIHTQLFEYFALKGVRPTEDIEIDTMFIDFDRFSELYKICTAGNMELYTTYVNQFID